MRFIRISCLAPFVFVLLFTVLFLGCSSNNNSTRLSVVTGTGNISQVVERVGGDRVTVANIIPPAQCPGHFDVKPGDIQKLSDARLFIIHSWQGEKFSQDLIASIDNEDLSVVRVDLPGNWLVPSVQREAADRIAEALAEVDSAHASEYRKSAAEYKSQISLKESELQDRLARPGLAGINVLCNEQQAGFVSWLGLNIVGTYSGIDDLTPLKVKSLVDIGQISTVTLVIDNLQNGADAGKGLAESLNVRRITLSNFPGGVQNTETWEKTVDYNVELVIQSLSQ